ncbi:metal dependent phosphohydrolase [Calderihabitans maritimus]|uniref:Metal dependent phosphohydrolase n=2 Tax=Calderihabitans maritimus TaxID=1246530 RepID=A0A1Z5HRR7_9FIRM|nr:metal dependent phosphohydrolase [Calderihabitans maritimus]
MAILENPLYNDYIQRIDFKEKGRPFCRHNLDHFLSTARISYILLLENDEIDMLACRAGIPREKVKELVYAAGLLHDIGRWKAYETGEDHARLSARYAKEILQESGYTSREIEVICQAIMEHRGKSKHLSLLGERLHQADSFSRSCYQCSAQNECYKFNRDKYRLEY